jgi:hypothetical protein
VVLVHPFANGNGRHSRLAADLLVTALGGVPVHLGRRRTHHGLRPSGGLSDGPAPCRPWLRLHGADRVRGARQLTRSYAAGSGLLSGLMPSKASSGAVGTRMSPPTRITGVDCLARTLIACVGRRDRLPGSTLCRPAKQRPVSGIGFHGQLARPAMERSDGPRVCDINPLSKELTFGRVVWMRCSSTCGSTGPAPDGTTSCSSTPKTAISCEAVSSATSSGSQPSAPGSPADALPGSPCGTPPPPSCASGTRRGARRWRTT